MIRALIATLLTTGLQQVANLASGMLTAHFLMPTGRGELAAAQLWPTTIAYLAVLGLGDAVLYFSANKREPARAIFATAVVVGVVLSAVAMAITYWVVLPYAYANDQYRPEIRELATILLLLIPATLFGVFFQEMLRGQMRLFWWNLIRVSLSVAYVAFILVVVGLEDASVHGFALAYLAAQLVPVFGALAVIWASGWARLDAVNRGTARAMLGYGAKVHVGGVIAMINQRADQLLIAKVLAPASLGLYVVATALSQVTLTLAQSITQVAYPRACAADEGERGRVIGLYLRLALVLLLAGGVALWIVAPYALALMFGRDFTAATPVVRILLLGIPAMAARDFFMLAFKAWDRSLAISKNEGVMLVFNIALLLVLVPRLELIGAALSFVVVRWIGAAHLAYRARRDLGLRLRALMVPSRADVDLARGLLADLLSRRERTRAEQQ